MTLETSAVTPATPQVPLEAQAKSPPRSDEPETVTLGEDLRLLAEEARTLARAELTFQKARASYAAGQVRRIAVLLVVAAVVVFFAAMAFVLGLVLALAPLITPWGAMAVVTLGLLALASLSAFRARRTLDALKRIMADPAPERENAP